MICCVVKKILSSIEPLLTFIFTHNQSSYASVTICHTTLLSHKKGELIYIFVPNRRDAGRQNRMQLLFGVDSLFSIMYLDTIASLHSTRFVLCRNMRTLQVVQYVAALFDETRIELRSSICFCTLVSAYPFVFQVPSQL